MSFPNYLMWAMKTNLSNYIFSYSINKAWQKQMETQCVSPQKMYDKKMALKTKRNNKKKKKIILSKRNYYSKLKAPKNLKIPTLQLRKIYHILQWIWSYELNEYLNQSFYSETKVQLFSINKTTHLWASMKTHIWWLLST